MRRIRPLRIVTAALLVGLMLAAAPAALAAPTTVALSSGTLKVIGDDSAETYSLEADFTVSPATFTIRGPSGFTAPAGCTSTATSVTCPFPTATAMSLDTAGGADTIDEKSKYPAVALVFGGVPIAATGGAGNDTLNAVNAPLTGPEGGGEGDDVFNGLDSGGDGFRPEPGNDTYNPDVAPAPLSLGATTPFFLIFLADTYFLTGSTGVNVSVDGVRNDTDGMGGTDDVGPGLDLIVGTEGDDTITGGSGPIKIFGQAGNDTITGSSAGDMILSGGAGDDVVRGGDGDDVMDDGDSVADYVDDGVALPPPGNDTLDGGPGDDSLSATLGNDDVHGGDGEDTVMPGRFRRQVVDVDAPGFTPPAPQFEPVTVSLDDQANDGATGSGEADNIHADVEDVNTTRNFASRIISSDDAVTGSSVSNEIITGGGADTVDAGAGPDVVDTGTEDDRIAALDKTPDSVSCGKGTDAVEADLPGEDPANADALYRCEGVAGEPLPPARTGVPGTGPATRVPKLKLSGSTVVKTRRFLKGRVLPVSVLVDQPCSARGEAVAAGARIAKVGDLSIGSGSLRRGGGKRTLKVKVAKRYAASLKRRLRTAAQRRRGVKLRVVVTVTNAAGRSASASRTLTVKG